MHGQIKFNSILDDCGAALEMTLLMIKNSYIRNDLFLFCYQNNVKKAANEFYDQSSKHTLAQ